MMDWFKTNPMTGAIAAAALLVLLVGGYLTYSQAARFSEEQTLFDEKVAQLQSLRGNKPFPDAANAEAAEKEAEQAKAALSELEKAFGSIEAPKLGPQAFQDELSKAVKEMQTLSADKGVKLADGFYLGFEAYETQPPSEAVSSQLGLQLRAIQAVVRALIESKTTSVDALVRTPLPGEYGAKSADVADGKQPPANEASSSFELLPFDIAFTADQPSFRLALNRISDLKPPVFVRLAAITNSMVQPPAKSALPEAPETTEAPVETADSPGIKPVLGRESLHVELRLASVAGQPKVP
ncbi:MAG: hypothetical protein RIQ71_1759 [Verrucomicrobiota bacterium]|jgi:hypothetical protein